MLSEFSLPGSPWSQAAEPFRQGFINLPGQGSIADMHKAGLRFGAEAGKVTRRSSSLSNEVDCPQNKIHAGVMAKQAACPK